MDLGRFAKLCTEAGFPPPSDWDLDERTSAWLRTARARWKGDQGAWEVVRGSLVGAAEAAMSDQWDSAAQQLAEARQNWNDLGPRRAN